MSSIVIIPEGPGSYVIKRSLIISILMTWYGIEWMEDISGVSFYCVVGWRGVSHLNVSVALGDDAGHWRRRAASAQR